MSDESAKAFNSVLKSAGISTANLQVTSCSETGPCEVQYKETPTSPNRQTKVLQTPEEFFNFVRPMAQLQSKGCHRASQKQCPVVSAPGRRVGDGRCRQ
jgi:hypothetical protein